MPRKVCRADAEIENYLKGCLDPVSDILKIKVTKSFITIERPAYTRKKIRERSKQLLA